MCYPFEDEEKERRRYRGQRGGMEGNTQRLQQCAQERKYARPHLSLDSVPIFCLNTSDLK